MWWDLQSVTAVSVVHGGFVDRKWNKCVIKHAISSKFRWPYRYSKFMLDERLIFIQADMKTFTAHKPSTLLAHSDMFD